MKRLVALGLVLIVSAHVSAQQAPVKPVLQPADVLGTFIGYVKLPFTSPKACEDQWARALTFVEEVGAVYVITGCHMGGVILKWKIPLSSTDTLTSNTATYVKNMGTATFRGEVRGVKWDALTSTLFVGYTPDYDTTTTIQKSQSRNVLDPATGLLTSTGTFTFAPRSDRATPGAITFLPDWFQQATGCSRFATTGGGYYSIDWHMPNHRGPAMACVPAGLDLASLNPTLPVPQIPLVGYPTSASENRFAHRTPDYVELIKWDAAPQRAPVGQPGLMGPGDAIWPGGTFLDTTERAAAVFVVRNQIGCKWYGDNGVPPKKPIQREPPDPALQVFVKPLSTDLTANSVTMPATVTWPTGTLVNLSALNNGGCTNDQYTPCAVGLHGTGFWAYFLRREASGAYTFHNTAAAANDSAAVPIDLAAPITTGLMTVSYCSASPGKGAALNSDGTRVDLYLYDPADLIAVANGQKHENEIQPASITPLPALGGIPNPNLGKAQDYFVPVGADYLPSRRLYGVLFWNLTNLYSRPTLLLWRVGGTASPNLPSAPFGLHVVTS